MKATIEAGRDTGVAGGQHFTKRLTADTRCSRLIGDDGGLAKLPALQHRLTIHRRDRGDLQVVRGGM